MAWEDFVFAFFNWDIVAQAWPILLAGLIQTLKISALVIPVGLAGGMILALSSRARSKLIRGAAAVWTDLFRALPPLVLLIFVYAGLPFAGIELTPWTAVALAFFLNTGSYYGEVLRAGLDSVPAGQAEAARALGLRPWQVMGLVVLPQAVRNVLPDLVSNTLEVVKLTSIASVVGLPELLFQARQAQSVTYNATPIIVAAVAYFILLWPVVRLLSRLENKAIARRA